MAGYSVERSITVNAAPHHVHALLDDFHKWPAWSPWEDLDPDLQRTYTGPEKGVGARYAWRGNRKAGAGSMEIQVSTPTWIEIALEFLKPFKASNLTTFELTESGSGTEVTWRMTGEQQGLMNVFSRFVSMDRMIGPDFEKGLARLKAVAEETKA